MSSSQTFFKHKKRDILVAKVINVDGLSFLIQCEMVDELITLKIG